MSSGQKRNSAMILERIDPERKATLLFCCDGRNDISLVDHLQDQHPDHLIIAPSNADPSLKARLEGNPRAHILEQDCTRFGEGAAQVLRDRGYLG